MAGRDRDAARDERIEKEVFVDAYTCEEQAMGWAVYLEESLDPPFEARCVEEREVSPLEVRETVHVVGVTATASSLRRQFVAVEWRGRELGVPLGQLEPVEADAATRRAIADWHYWLER